MAHSQVMIVLVGLPGSGKSTFSRNFIESIPEGRRDQWQSLNQDALKKRSTMIEHTEYYLYHNYNLIIDRCNFNEWQRSHWINLAHKYAVPVIIAIVMPTNMKQCIERATSRGVDDLHPELTDWKAVCNMMRKDWSPPNNSEGFDFVFTPNDENELNDIMIDLVGKLS